MTAIIRVLAIAAGLLLTSCANQPFSLGNAGVEQSSAIGEISELLDRYFCPGEENVTTVKDCRDFYRGSAEAKLLRAHLLVAVFARYGAARIEDYSGEPADDAAKLLRRVKEAETSIAAALDELARKGHFFEVERADVAFALIDVVAAAARPTMRELSSIVLPASPLERAREGKKLLWNALADEVYAHAYRESFGVLIDGIRNKATKSPTEADWKEVNRHLTAACGRLAGMARMDATEEAGFCIVKGVPGT